MMVDMAAPAVQTIVASVVGVSKQAISSMVQEGKLPDGVSNGALIAAYCERLREQAAGRLGDTVGGLDPAQESAALKRSQREAQDIKNAVARREFAPVGLLADVLGMAAGAVVDRFDQLEGTLRKSCPDISDEVMFAVLGVVTSARNEWIRSTARLVDESLQALASQDEEPAEADDEEQPA